MRLEFISESQIRGLIQKENATAAARGLSFIKNSVGFSNHSVNVGEVAFETAAAIRKRNPPLRGEICSKVVRTAGYMHDFGKIWIGDPYHEIATAYTILERGEELGLVKKGTPDERESQLIRIASCVPSDYLLREGLGSDFPQTAMHPEFVTSELEFQVENLRKRLSKGNTPLSIQELTTLDTYERKILLYADMGDNDGLLTVKQRLDEIAERYGGEYAQNAKSEKEAEFYRVTTQLIRKVGKEFIQTYNEIKQLAGG